MYLPDRLQLVRIIRQAAAPIKKHFRQAVDVTTKEDGTPVSEVDLAVHQKLLAWTKSFPGLGYIGEEGNDFSDDCFHALYVDPLDGTNAYLRGIPTATVAVSLMKKIHATRWEPIISVIHDPINSWTCSATKEESFVQKGLSDVSGSLLQVSKLVTPWRITAVAWRNAPWNLERVQSTLLLCDDVDHQSLGATALGGALIASGLMDALIFGGKSAVETAAMSLIVRSAGGVATDLFGSPLTTYELVEQNGKLDFQLPYGSIMSSSSELTRLLTRVVKTVQ